MTDEHRSKFGIPALVIAGLLLLAVCVPVAGYLTWREQAGELQRQAEQSLAAIADLKAHQISAWLTERRGDVETLHDNPLLPQAADAWFRDGDRERFDLQAIPLLTTMQAIYDYEGVLVLDDEGVVRQALPGETAGLAAEERRLIARASASREPQVSDLYRGASDGVVMSSVVPLVVEGADGPRTVGSVVLRSAAREFLFPTIQDWPLPSPTGETLLVERDGGDVVFLNELRHREGTALTLREPAGSPTLPAAIAVRGDKGVTVGADYRGAEVVFAYRPVTGTPWTVVAKIDRSEVIGPAAMRGWLMAGLIAGFAMVVFLAILLWWRSRTARVNRGLLEERLQAEEALRAAEERLRLATENASDVIWTLDLETLRFTYMSPSVEPLRGFTPEEVVQEDAAAALAPASLDLMRGVLPERIAEYRRGKGKTYVEEIEQPTKTGGTVWTETTTRLGLDESTGHIVAYGVSRDITARREAEERLRSATERERFLADVVERAPLAFATGDQDGRLLSFNQAFADLTGYSRAEIEDMKLTWTVDLTPPEWRASEAVLLERACATRQPIRYEKEYLRKDGSRVPVELVGQAVYDEKGDVLHVLAFVTDISERKRAEKELARRQMLLNAVLESSPDPIFVKDRAGILMLANPATITAVGRPADRILGHRDDEFYDDQEAAAAIMANDRRIMESGRPEIVEEQMVLPDETRTFLSSKTPWRDADGNVIGLIGITRDITARKRAEEEQERQKDLLASVLDSPEGVLIFALDTAYRYTAFNEPHRREMRRVWSAEIDLGVSMLDLLTIPEVHEIARRSMDRALSGETFSEIQTQPDTGIVYEFRWNPIHAADGRVAGLTCFAQDVTAIHQAMDAVRQSEERLRLAGTAGRVGLYEWHTGHGTVYWSPEAFELFGVDPDEPAGYERWLEAVHPDDRDAMQHTMAKLTERDPDAAGVTRRDEYRVLHRDGTVLWLEAATASEYDGDDIVLRGWVRNVTERVIAENALRESDQRFRLALRNAPVSVSVQDRDLRYVWAYNQRTAMPEEIIGHFDEEIFAPEEAKRLAAIKRRVIEEGIETRERMWLDRPTGPIYLDVVFEPIHDEAGLVTGVGTATIDLTAMKIAEEAAQESRDDLNRAQAVAHTGSWRLDVRRNVLLWSDESYRIFGKPLGSPQAYDSFLSSVHPDDRDYVDREWTAALGGAPYDIEHRIVVGDTVKWVRERAELELDETGTALGGFGTTEDITERKHTEDALRALAAELEVERGKLAAAIERVDVGLVFTDGTGTFLSMNAKALELHVFDSNESMFAQFERYVEDFELRYPDGSPMPLEDWPMSRALRGEYVRDYETRVRRRDSGDEWIGSYSAAPVYGSDGEIVLIVFSIFDLTIRRRLQEELRHELETTSVLLQAASAFAGWTDSLETLPGVVNLVAAAAGHSRVGLHVWHADDKELELVAATGEGGMPPIGTRTSPGRLSATTRRALLTKRTTVTDFGKLAPTQRGMAEEAGALLSLSVPIVHRDELVGLLALDEPGEHREFTVRQIELVEGIAAQAAVAIENAGLYDAQRRIATVLQEQFIHPLPKIDGLELAVVAETASQPELVGGDFHDVFELPHGMVAVLLGDVEGKGVSAAALSETVRSAVRALAIISASPRYILNNVNRMLLQQGSQQFVTALLTIVDPADGLALSASAGHPSGILLRDGTVSSIAMRFGVPLGALPWDHEQTSFRLEPGDRLILYTDGVSEARCAGEIFGEEGVVETLRTVVDENDPDALAKAVRDASAEYAGKLNDDMQLVVVRFTGRVPSPDAQAGTSHLSLVVPDAPWRLVDVRGSVRDFLAAHNVDGDAIDDLVMCVEEACTNALRHSGSREPTEVRLSVDRTAVDVAIRDYGCGFDTDGLDFSRLPDPLAMGGRGLYLIRSVVDELELTNSAGTTVHLRRFRGERS